MSVEQGAECLSVMADDTNVYILLLHYYNQKELNIPMYMESPVHGRQTIDIRATAKEHANILPNLLAAHGLSGCDTIEPCYGIGKMKILKTLKQGNHSLRGQAMEKSTFSKELTHRSRTYELRGQGGKKKAYTK